MNFTGMPAINGIPINYAPARVLDNPVVQSEWNSGVVYLRKGMRATVLDFKDSARSRENL